MACEFAYHLDINAYKLFFIIESGSGRSFVCLI